MTPSSTDTTTLTLPCGRTARVQAFNGNAQRIINEMQEAFDQKQAPDDDVTERLLSEVVITLTDDRGEAKRPRAQDLLALPTGSRHAILAESRRLSYGPEVKVEHVCGECRKTTAAIFDISRAFLTQYPEGMRPVRFESGGRVFAIGWGSGVTQKAFRAGKRMKLWGLLDEPLSRVQSVDGKPMGPRDMLKMSAQTLDAVRRAGRAMVPMVMPEGSGGALEANAGDSQSAPTDPIAIITDPTLMPCAGFSERVQVQCQHCGHVGVSLWVAAEDFLLRGTLEALAD